MYNNITIFIVSKNIIFDYLTWKKIFYLYNLIKNKKYNKHYKIKIKN